jgi:flagellar hook protein FlgE
MALINSLTSGVSALKTFGKSLEVIGDNIANINTTGFKGSRAYNQDSFSDVLRRSAPSGATGSNTDAMQVGSGVNLAAIRQKFTQGSLKTTGNPSDLGIAGNGFFRVKDSVSGKEYLSRAGDFRMDDQGFLVTNGGYRVQGLTGGTPPSTVGDIQLSVPPAGTQLESYSIDAEGKITEFYSDGTSAVTNQLLLQDCKDLNALMRVGNNLFSSIDAAGPVGGVALTAANNAPGTNGLGAIVQGALELSNVDLTEEFSELIVAQRSFQAASRVVTVSDQVIEELVNIKR